VEINQKPMKQIHTLYLLRHGESVANAGDDFSSIPDYIVPMTVKGHEQAREAGCALLSFQSEPLTFLASPYQRTEETLNGVLSQIPASMILEKKMDVRLREQEYGDFEKTGDYQQLRALRSEPNHCNFYHRFYNGESGCDVALRLQSLWQDLTLNPPLGSALVIISHSYSIRCLLLILLGWSPEYFNGTAKIPNAKWITLKREHHTKPWQLLTEIPLRKKK
jgi:broad specificity phosphatase PhoE